MPTAAGTGNNDSSINFTNGQVANLKADGSIRIDVSDRRIFTLVFINYFIAYGYNTVTTTGVYLNLKFEDNELNQIPLSYGQQLTLEQIEKLQFIVIKRADNQPFTTSDTLNFTYIITNINKKIDIKQLANTNNQSYYLFVQTYDITIANANTLTQLFTGTVTVSKVMIYNPSSTDTVQIYVNSSTEYVNLLPETYWIFDFEPNTFNISNISVSVPTANDVLQVMVFK